MPFSILGVFSLAVQVYFAVHAGKTGRYNWIFLILIFPFVGSLIYFFVEFLPEVQAGARIRRPQNIKPAKNIKSLERNLELSDTIKNKINLAEAYFDSGRYNDSIKLLETCLEGLYAKDNHVLEGICYSYFCLNDFQNARKYLLLIEENSDKKISDELRMIKARILEQLGDETGALEEYAAIVKTYAGEEARCRYALLLRKSGEPEKSKEIFNEIVRRSKFYSRNHRKLYKKWIDTAKSELAEMA